MDEERRRRGESYEKAFVQWGGARPISRRVMGEMGVHRRSDSGSQGLTGRSKKRNAGGAANARGGFRLQDPKKGGNSCSLAPRGILFGVQSLQVVCVLATVSGSSACSARDRLCHWTLLLFNQ